MVPDSLASECCRGCLLCSVHPPVRAGCYWGSMPVLRTFPFRSVFRCWAKYGYSSQAASMRMDCVSFVLLRLRLFIGTTRSRCNGNKNPSFQRCGTRDLLFAVEPPGIEPGSDDRTRSILRAQSIGLMAISRPLRMPWTARSGPSGTKSPRSAVQRNASSKPSQRRSTVGRRQPDVSGVADSLVNPGAKAQAARANSVRLDLALISLRRNVNEQTSAFSARFPAMDRSPSKPIGPFAVIKQQRLTPHASS